jgi:hypothetical protein
VFAPPTELEPVPCRAPCVALTRCTSMGEKRCYIWRFTTQPLSMYRPVTVSHRNTMVKNAYRTTFTSGLAKGRPALTSTSAVLRPIQTPQNDGGGRCAHVSQAGLSGDHCPAAVGGISISGSAM